MKKRSLRLIVLKTLKRFGLLCKPDVKDPYIKVASVARPDGTKTILSGKVRREEIVNEKDLESAIHVWKEVRKKPRTRKRVSTKK
jgi:hypothetical protein